MKQEDKELLLRDLCARLPHGVKCKHESFTSIYTLYAIDSERSAVNLNSDDLKFNDYMFENRDVLSGKIASAEYCMIGSHTNPVSVGLGGTPFNFNKPTDYLEVLTMSKLLQRKQTLLHKLNIFMHGI